MHHVAALRRRNFVCILPSLNVTIGGFRTCCLSCTSILYERKHRENILYYPSSCVCVCVCVCVVCVCGVCVVCVCVCGMCMWRVCVLCFIYLWTSIDKLQLLVRKEGRSQWPYVLRGSAVARLLGLRFRIPPGALISYVSCECCVLSGSVLCDVPFPLAEKFHLVCVFVSLSVIRCNKTLYTNSE